MLTELEKQQRNERRKKYFGPERNARRKERYDNDPAYREREVERARVRKSQPLSPEEDPRRFIGRLGGEAVTCHVYPVDENGKDPTPRLQDKGLPQTLAYRMEDLGRMLGRGTSVLNRWKSQDKLPPPRHIGLVEAKNVSGPFLTHVGVYLGDEVEAILQVMGDHFEQTPYYHNSHTETRDKLFEEVAKTRNKAHATRRNRRAATAEASA